MEWTQEKLENLYQEVNQKAKEDPEYLKKLREDPRAAMEEVAGCALPKDLQLNFVDGETNHANTYVLPNFIRLRSCIQYPWLSGGWLSCSRLSRGCLSYAGMRRCRLRRRRLL